MPHHHVQHTQNVGPNLFVHNENSAYIMPHATTCAVTSCTHIAQCAHADKPAALLIYIQELLMDMPFMQAEQYLSKITTSHFSTLNMKIANQNVLRRILIAMHNENKADCNENLRKCAEDLQSELANVYI